MLNLILSLVVADPGKRPTAKQALSMEWIETVASENSPNLEKPITVGTYVSPHQVQKEKPAKKSIVINSIKNERKYS